MNIETTSTLQHDFNRQVSLTLERYAEHLIEAHEIITSQTKALELLGEHVRQLERRIGTMEDLWNSDEEFE